MIKSSVTKAVNHNTVSVVAVLRVCRAPECLWHTQTGLLISGTGGRERCVSDSSEPLSWMEERSLVSHGPEEVHCTLQQEHGGRESRQSLLLLLLRNSEMRWTEGFSLHLANAHGMHCIIRTPNPLPPKVPWSILRLSLSSVVKGISRK